MTATIAETVAAVDLGRASAQRRGRDPRWPYVPVILKPHHSGVGETQEQVRRLAFATRGEAVARAQQTIDARRADLARKLADPTQRALREHYGLPREIG